MLFGFHSNIRTKEFKIFPSLFFGFEKPVLAIPNLAHLLLPYQDANADAKSKELNPTAQQIGVLRTLFARALNVPQSAPQAYCIFILFFVLISTLCFSQQPNIGLQQLRQEQQFQTQQNNAVIYQKTKQENYNQVKEIEEIDKEEKRITKKVSTSRFRFSNINSSEYKQYAGNYIKAYNQLNEMLLNDTAIDIKRAIYITENPYLKDKLPYNQYLKLIQNKVSLVKHILKKEKLNPQNPDAVHYAIQKLYSDTLYIKQANGTIKTIKPFSYDFDDPFGEKETSKQLVSKLLVTGKGQCHSMPLLYMILAEEFHVKSHIAYSPNHSFIKFQTKNGTWYNFETTTGRLTTDAFVLGSGFIKSEALKSGIFNQPHNTKKVIANMFIYLANSYKEEFGYDDFQQKCVDKNVKYNGNYIFAKVVQSNYQTALTDLVLAQENYPAPKNISNYPYIKEQFQKRNALYDELDNLGFSSIDKESYKEWLQSGKQGEEKQNGDGLKIKLINQIKQ